MAISSQFAYALEGSTDAFLLAIVEHSLSSEARNALISSAAALGWNNMPTFLFADAQPPLTKAQIYEVIEGLDPLALIICGEQASVLVEAAYGTTVPEQGKFRLFGRDACAFKSLDTLLQTPTGKQEAWALLKNLPTAPE